MTPAQLSTVRTAVIADPTAAAYRTAGNAFELRAWLNAVPQSGAVSVWRTDAPVAAVLDAIDFSKYTPTAALDDATLTTSLLCDQRQAQLMAIQTKQMNLQTMVFGRTALDASKPNIRAGLRDAVIGLPSGAAGAAISAGGAGGQTVLTACTRSARRVEAMLVGADATTGPVTAKLLGFEGSADESDVNWLINN